MESTDESIIYYFAIIRGHHVTTKNYTWTGGFPTVKSPSSFKIENILFKIFSQPLIYYFLSN